MVAHLCQVSLSHTHLHGSVMTKKNMKLTPSSCWLQLPSLRCCLMFKEQCLCPLRKIIMTIVQHCHIRVYGNRILAKSWNNIKWRPKMCSFSLWWVMYFFRQPIVSLIFSDCFPVYFILSSSHRLNGCAFEVILLQLISRFAIYSNEASSGSLVMK